MIAQRKLDFPLTQIVSPVLPGRGKTKFRIFLYLLFVSLAPKGLFSEDLPTDKKLVACIVSRSPRVSAVLFQDFLAAVNARFDGECETQGVLVDDPFSESNKSLVSADKKIGFWIDAEVNGSVVLIRGIDYQSRLYWTQIRSNISASRPLVQDQMTAFVSEILNSFYYLGIVSNGRFFSWNPVAGSLAVVKRAAIERHPFLPYWLSAPKSDKVMMRGISLKRYAKAGIKLEVPEQNTLFSQSDLWLVQDNKNE